MALRETLARIRSQPPSNTVNATQIRVVLPILRDLGWDEHNPTLVDLEHRDASIVLLTTGDESASAKTNPAAVPSVYIKIAPPAASSRNVGPSVVAAAIRDGADICVATNGKTWTLYCPKPTDDPDDCQFAEWDIYGDPIERITSELKKYLDRQALSDRTAQALAGEALIAIRSTKRLAETVPSVWRRLVTDPDPFLVEYVQGEVQDEIGLTPSLEQVTEVIRGSLTTTGVQRVSEHPPELPHTHLDRRRPTGYRLWGEHHEIRRQREILTGVAEAIYQRHAEIFDRVLRVSRYFTTDRSTRKVPIPIGSSGYYHEGGLNRDVLERTVGKLLRAFGYSEDDLVVLHSAPIGRDTALRPASKRDAKRPRRRASRPPVGIRLWGTIYPATRQYEVLTVLAAQLYERHADRFDLALQVTQITKDPSSRADLIPIGATGYFHKRAIDIDRMRSVCGKLLAVFGYPPEDLEILYE